MTYRFNCEICGKEVIRPSYKSDMRFCSKQCMWKDENYRKIMIDAVRKLNTNRTQKMIDSTQKMGLANKGKHLSPETEYQKGELNPNWKGGTKKYRGVDWKEQRIMALERDKHICQRCGEKGEEVHHITPYSVSKDNSLDNLLTLCKRCHLIHERGYSVMLIDGEDIIIKHVPEKVRLAFEKFANEDFDGNTGLTLKHLMDFYIGLIPSGVEHLEVGLEKLEQEIELLKQIVVKPEVKDVKGTRLDGTGGK